MGTGFVDKFRQEAEKYLSEGRILSISFSGSTYQIEIEDFETGESVWPLLQFEDGEMLSDAFCSCGAEETCAHLAAAFLRIYNGTPEPLHVRFKESFWNAICFLLAKHLGFAPHHEIVEESRAFSIKAKNEAGKKFLNTLISKRPKETPETSLKFSNLSTEEIQHWKGGRASPALRYELSFWSDLAKHMMLLQDEKAPYTFTYEEEKGFPTHFHIAWKDFSVHFKCLKEDLPTLIPTLAKIDSPLKINALSDNALESITYESEKRQLHLVHKQLERKTFASEKTIDGWVYVSGSGFYPMQGEPLLEKEFITEKEIPDFLSLYQDQLAPFFKGFTVEKTFVPVAYALEFDRNWNLHLHSYVFKPQDTDFFDDWGYVHGKGFFPLKGKLFDPDEKIIAQNEISTFVHYHRNFLNTLPGFSIHLASIESAITYNVDQAGRLKFLSKYPEESLEMKDFGDWVYYKGQGFFPKKAPGISSVLFAGLEVDPRDINSFIKLHRDELETISHFFISQQVIAARGLTLKIVDEKTLEMEPVCRLFSEYKDRSFRFYGDFIYVKDLGFQEIPAHMRLPIKYQNKTEIHEKDFSYFFEQEFDHLKSLFLELDPRLETPLTLHLELIKLEKEPLGFDVDGHYIGESGKAPLSQIKEAIEKNQRYLFSEAGRLDLQDERFHWLRKTEKLTLTPLEFVRLDIVEGIKSTTPVVVSSLQELRTMTSHETPNLKGLQSDLRLYQKTGLDWLWFLYRNGLSGLLCDEMGLGKTHQAMALLAAVRNLKKEEKSKECRYLIVAPTSVIYHWQEKLATFLPDFKVHFFHGLKRSLKKLPKTGILLTSYGILRSERKALSKIPFEIAILDEIQVAKNPASRVHESLLEMQAKMRLGLTGTPIENYLRELKALFDLALPGYMPPEREFKEAFVLPIEREGNPEVKAQLSRIIRPFILRRKKQEVLQELPEKTIDKSACELSEEQLLLYSAMLEKERKPIVEQLQKGEGPIPYVHIFSILSKLKQICNHPALFHKTPELYEKHASGKWDLFVELLEEAMSGEQKVVIFSQYLQMLDIFSLYLQEKGWSYAQIRGDTLDRREQMNRFQTDPNCRVFLGSLNAAGLGIDLTAASIVILYDRWWNAARENQAIDRVHRIGQKWGVQVFKLITMGTIEEKIDQIITRKGRLMEEIVTADDEATIKRFSREELIDLFTLPFSK